MYVDGGASVWTTADTSLFQMGEGVHACVCNVLTSIFFPLSSANAVEYVSEMLHARLLVGH